MSDEPRSGKIPMSKLVVYFCTLPLTVLLWFLFLCTNILSYVLGRGLRRERGLRRKGAQSPSDASPLRDPFVSVIIPNYNGRELLEKSLPPLIQALENHPHEIIVVDNGSRDDSALFLRSTFPHVIVEECRKNLGFGGGCNRGAKKARGDILLFLNNDMVADKDFLPPLLKPFSDPAVFAVTSQIFLWDTQEKRVETGKTRSEFLFGALWVKHDSQGTDRPSAVFYAGGGSSAFDRGKFLELGGFDPLYSPFYGEDTDLSYQAWKRGWKVLYAPESMVYHKHRGTVSRYYSQAQVDRAMRKNLLLLLWANLTDPDMLLRHCLYLPCHLANHRAYIKPEYRISPGIFFSALKQLPAVLVRRVRTGPGRRFTDRHIFRALDHPVFLRDHTVPRRGKKPGEGLNILMVSPYAVYPLNHGGAVRMYNMIKYLSGLHNIFLLGYVDLPDQLDGLRELEKYCRLVKFRVRSSPFQNQDPFNTYPPMAFHFLSRDMKREILDSILQYDIDILQLEYTQMAFLDIETGTVPTILVEHDLSFRSLWRKKRRKMASILLEEKEAYRFSNWLKLVYGELHHCRRADQVHTMSEVDQRYLQSMLPGRAERIKAVSNGVDAEYYNMEKRTSGENTLVFVGNFRHTPNIEGILFFLENIWSLIKQEIKDVKLYIIGQKPPDDIRAMENGGDIVVTGFVEDLRTYYNMGTVFVAPIWAGSGTRLKILEAMAAGLPVVTTTVGAEGIACTDSREILLADTPEAFAARTCELLKNRQQRNDIAMRARKLVEETYDWRIIIKKLDAYYHLALKEKQAEGSAD